MGLFGKKKIEWQYVALEGGGEVETVGEAQYQDALERICGGKWTDPTGCWDMLVRAWLRRERDNRYDPNAVVVNVGEAKVGYLNREDAKRYGDMLESLERNHLVGCCDARIRGGWDRGDGDTGTFGIFLDLAAPPKSGTAAKFQLLD